MGEQDIRQLQDDQGMRDFVKALLDDVRALERMVASGAIETGVRRIGAEQEMFLATQAYRPARNAPAVLSKLDDSHFTTELGLFNLEANLTPHDLRDRCLSAMEAELEELVGAVRAAAAAEGSRVVLCGILPTLEQSDLGLDAMTPHPRYAQLNQVMKELRGGEFRTLIKGLDELQITHDNVMLEACNTDFQIHFQVGPEEFADLYNMAQAVTAPVLAAAVNSPVLLKRRLWHETRVALFQQSLDVRSDAKTRRGGRQRVSFGERWIDDSVLEIFREDIARFRVLLSVDTEEKALEVLDRGGVPQLRALRLHNGTVYRWNRPCYGVHEGQAHLRIENRVLPAGPSILDEVANAAFFFGLMIALSEEYGDITRVMSFDDARANFRAAARYGLDSQLRWIGGDPYAAGELILEHLLPLARAGLAQRGVPAADLDRYLGVIEKRVETGRTGAQWALDSLAQMSGKGSADDCARALTVAMTVNQEQGTPVHEWENADLEDSAAAPESYRRVGQIMTTDLFTVHPEDVVDLAASLMDWEHIRHVPVEDHDGKLVGLLSHRRLLRRLAQDQESTRSIPVREVMQRDPISVEPETACLEAMETMRRHRVGCLPVVEEGRLVGIVTEKDFIAVAGRLLENWLRND